MVHPPTRNDFDEKLSIIISPIEELGLSFIDIKAGDLHKIVGGYPGPDHRMPTCCEAMYETMKSIDKVLDQPPKGKGASLIIRYFLPR